MRRRGFRNWENSLKENGYKLTNPRKTILEALERRGGHPNAREILLELSRKNSEIGLTTIYRTLDLFVKLGILKRYDFGDRQNRYELFSEDNEHHHHLICKKCIKVIEYDDFLDEETTLIKKIEKMLTEKYDFVIDKHELTFYGYCKNCRK
ncbi:MAG: Fur family transcriptional regulator [Acidobacteriota bacterium]